MPFDPSAATPSSILSDNPSYQAAWIVYINGVEVPVVEISTTCGVWQIPQATIQLVPDIVLQRLGAEDRVPVQIFYLDYWYNRSAPEFRLLFDGEITGWEFSSSQGNRTIQFNCIAHIHVFQQLYFSYMTNVDDIVAAQAPDMKSSGFTQAGLLYPYALFHQGLLATNSQVTQQGIDAEAVDATAPIKAPFEFVYNLIRGIIGKEVPPERKSLPMINAFARHTRKTRLHNRFVRLPLLEDPETLFNKGGVFPIFNAVRADEALNAMQKQVANQSGSSGPVWNTMQQVLNLVYMELAMLPTPPAVIVQLTPAKGERTALAQPETFQQRGERLALEALRSNDPTLRAALQNMPYEAIKALMAAEDRAREARLRDQALAEGNPLIAQALRELPREAMQSLINLDDQRIAREREAAEEANTIYEAQDGKIIDLLTDSTEIQTQVAVRKTDSELRVLAADLSTRIRQDVLYNQESAIDRAVRLANQAVASARANNTTEDQRLLIEALNATPLEATNALIAAEERTRKHVTPEELRAAGFDSLPATLAEVNEERVFQGLQLAMANQEGEEGVDTTKPIRLAQYFVKPEMQFGIPPHSNVIFPSQVMGWSYDENYINQPTRVYVNDSVMTKLLRAKGPNAEFMAHALTVAFPEEADAIMHHKLGGSSEGNSGTPGMKESGKNLLIWPEEYYKMPVVEKLELPSWFQMLMQFSNSNSTPESQPTGRLVNPNGDIAASAPVTVAPGSTTPETIQQINGVLNTDGIEIAEAGPRAGYVAQNGNVPYAQRVLIGRRTMITLNGSQAERYRIRFNGGLDPDYYRPPLRTALWPLPPPSRGTRRGRAASPSEFKDRSELEKRGQLFRLFYPEVQKVVTGLNEDQTWAATFAFLWLALTEGASHILFSWAFGNQAQYDAFPRKTWTVNPGDKRSYVAADSPQLGAQIFCQEAVRLRQKALQVLLNGRSSDAGLQAVLSSKFTEADARFYQRYAPVRPDMFYVALGYYGYYSTESDIGADHNSEENQIRRAQIGYSRVGGFKSWFQRVRGIWDKGTIPPDVISAQPYPARPLISQEDLDFLKTQEAVAASGGRANQRTTGRELRRIGLDPRLAAPGTTPSGIPSATTTANNTFGEGIAEQDAANRGAAFADLFRIYAQYRFLKSRYEKRNLAAQLVFNPYLLPGFPGIMFDSMRTRMHAVGSVRSVSHRGSATGSIGTQVQFTACRTFAEFLADVRNDAERFSARVVAAPAEVIREVRLVIQDETKAEEFYRRLFYGNSKRPTEAPVAFRWDQCMGYAEGVGVQDIYIVGEDIATADARERAGEVASDTASEIEQGQERAFTDLLETGTANSRELLDGVERSVQAGGLSSRGQLTVNTNLDPNKELSPKANIYQDAFRSYDVAMELASRPICSLEQYIRFWHAGRTINDLRNTGEVGDLRDDFAYVQVDTTDVIGTSLDGNGIRRNIRGNVKRSPAMFYSRIFKLRPGPGTGEDRIDAPSAAERGYSDPPNVQPVSTPAGVAADYPQTRADWDLLLTIYAEKVRRLLRPST